MPITNEVRELRWPGPGRLKLFSIGYTCRTLKISKATLLKTIKKTKDSPEPVPHVRIRGQLFFDLMTLCQWTKNNPEHHISKVLQWVDPMMFVQAQTETTDESKTDPDPVPALPAARARRRT